MLKKLFKYDMKADSRLMLPLIMLVLATTVAGTAALRFLNHLNRNSGAGLPGTAETILKMALGLIFLFSVLMVVAFFVISLFVILSRYYKNCFTDEGYLTFTLPVKTSTHLFSKLWSGLLWLLIAIAIGGVCVFIYVGFGSAEHGLFNGGLFRDAVQAFKAADAQFGSLGTFGVSMIITGASQIINTVLAMMLAITIGSIIAKKHKILAAIGFYYIINAAVSTLVLIISIISLRVSGSVRGVFGIYSAYSPFDFGAESLPFFVMSTLLNLFVAAGEFAIMHHLIKNKLNLV